MNSKIFWIKKAVKAITVVLIISFILLIIKYFFSIKIGDLFVDLFMSDVELPDNIPLSRGTLLWPKLKTAIIISLIFIVLSAIFIYIYTGYQVEKKTKDRVEKDCSKVLAEIIRSNELPNDYDKIRDYNIFFNTLKIFFSKYYRIEDEIEKNKIKDELITNFTHDIKTPLTSVIGYLNLLDTDTDLSEKSKNKYIKIALLKALYLEKLLDDLFYLTKYDSDYNNKLKEQVNLAILLNQLKDEFYPQLTDKNMDINLLIEKDVYIITFVEEFSKALGNIIKNAINYGYENSSITLEALIKDNMLTLNISNYTDELTKNELSLIFERFYRGKNSRSSSQEGSGLGLAIAKKIITDLGGNIKAHSNNNQFTVSISLPNIVNEKTDIKS
ncbi:two-component system sensor histidine kinase VanS [Herbinix hemicellulosilytica]|uniref:histidine kinase n=1 Tax=Herbinix hemicellulosilytica TaxID=1564487 RepID=A0A0H5SHR9_HERHM|nr:HAMP domain-containing sensor histidine kinase [Herbinix hemicellulosilytica]RBP58498.1 two-component system sensor histidine kinase VanS [Herbinix hemicellulosilytica]CRZ35037.1 hypothetical protein HHT355_1837 [Herbinix hemicellulosilytica]